MKLAECVRHHSKSLSVVACPNARTHNHALKLVMFKWKNKDKPKVVISSHCVLVFEHHWALFAVLLALMQGDKAVHFTECWISCLLQITVLCGVSMFHIFLQCDTACELSPSDWWFYKEHVLTASANRHCTFFCNVGTTWKRRSGDIGCKWRPRLTRWVSGRRKSAGTLRVASGPTAKTFI